MSNIFVIHMAKYKKSISVTHPRMSEKGGSRAGNHETTPGFAISAVVWPVHC